MGGSSGRGADSSEAGGIGGAAALGLAALGLLSWATGASRADAPGVPSEGGGGMLLLLPSSLGALLLGVLLSLGGSGLGIALSEAEEGGSDEGGGADWGSDEGSVGASSEKTWREIKSMSHHMEKEFSTLKTLLPSSY